MPKGSKRQSLYHGIIIVDKPSGMTSQDVVTVVRKAAGTRRVGHTGTLDPLATGLLLLMLGEATKLSEYLVGYDKTYEGTMHLGARSDTYDVEGRVEETDIDELPGIDALNEMAQDFTGEIEQIPPPYSAVKIKGKKLYEYARKGETVEAEPRPVRVDEYTLLGQEQNKATFRVRCSSGTYVRSLVHDLGAEAGCGALVEELRRTEIGDFNISEAISLEEVRESKAETFGSLVTPMVDVIPEWPVFHINQNGALWIRRGQAIPVGMCELDGESRSPGIGDLAFLCPLGKDAMAVVKTVPAPPGNPPAELKRFTGLWLQPLKLLSPEDLS